MYTVHATKKLLDRAKAPITKPIASPSTALGNWYATARFWKPQVALFVNERTLLPVLIPLAPATTVTDRFPSELRRVLDALGIDPRFVDAEVSAMADASWAKTESRSALGSINEFIYLAEAHRAPSGPQAGATAAIPSVWAAAARRSS